MTEFTDQKATEPASGSLSSQWVQLLSRHHWLPFVLPFVTFMLFGLLEPSPASQQSHADSSGGSVSNQMGEPPQLGAEKPLLSYPLAYSLRLAATGIAVLLVWPAWRTIPREISWKWALSVGALGGLMWVGICQAKPEDHLLQWAGLGGWASFGDRAAFDPYTALGDVPTLMVAFLSIRVLGLTVIVPLVEEFFLRGFLTRFFERPDWWTIPLGAVSARAALVATLYGVLAHPGELLAAALWFSLITLLYWRSRRIWDCIVAHAVTNAVLGFYVLTQRDWTLW